MVARQGTWWTDSKSDPRWNMSGRGLVSAFGCPELNAAIEKKKLELGEEPPDDLEVGGMKD